MEESDIEVLVEEILEAFEEDHNVLNEWEMNFCEEVYDEIHDIFLTEKQEAKIRQIHKRLFS